MRPDLETKLAKHGCYARFREAGGDALCGEGWYALLDACLAEIDGTGVTVTAVKQKLGLLRVGVEGLGEQGWERLLELERTSGTVCEVCGRAGRLQHDGRALATRCGTHRRMSE